MRLAADANVLLSAALGGRARLVLDHPDTEVFTTEATLAEVQEYAAHLVRKRRLRVDVVLLTVASLPVTLIAPEDYAAARAEAVRRIASRDPDDVDIHDFDAAGVEWLTTAEVLARLGRRRST